MSDKRDKIIQFVLSPEAKDLLGDSKMEFGEINSIGQEYIKIVFAMIRKAERLATFETLHFAMNANKDQIAAKIDELRDFMLAHGEYPFTVGDSEPATADDCSDCSDCSDCIASDTGTVDLADSRPQHTCGK